MKKIILLAILLLTQQFLFSQCLNGIYTIGGSAPSFTSINQAVNTLTLNGVCGPVTFNIRPGTYIEKMVIPQIVGTTSVNTITFQSENSDSSSVIIQEAGTSAALNYIFKLDGADYINFKKLTIKNTDFNVARVFYLLNGVLNFTLSNCVVESPNSPSSLPNSNRSLVNSATNTNANFLVRNSSFKGGQRGIDVASLNTLTNDLQLTGNVFTDQYEYSVYLLSCKSPVVSSNKVSYTLANTTFKGIYLSSCTQSLVIEKNIIDQTFGDGIVSLTQSTTPGVYSKISNNRINISGTSNSYGIYLQNGSYYNVFHNTVVTSNTNNSSACIWLASTNFASLRNNIFYNKSVGYVIYGAATNTNFSSNYNDLYASGLVFNISATNKTFAEWKNMGYDLNSLNHIPQFISTTNFHIASDFSQNLSIPYQSSIPDDIEGTVRDNVSPYFGAYEYANVLNASDASVNTVYTSTYNCIGNNPVRLQIKNYGTNNLTSATVNWSVNGALQSPFGWTGNLNFYDTTSVTIGNFNFLNLGSYIVKAWTSMPNGVADNFTQNDTARSSTMYTALTGTYTIGGASPTYTSIAAANSGLTSRGVCGNAVFNIRNGVYTGSFNLPAIIGLSGSNSLVIQSETGVNTAVQVQSTSSQSTFFFNGAQNITVKNITIGGSSVAAASVLLLSGSGNIEINGCIITSLNYDGIVCNISSALFNKLRIINNIFPVNNNAIYLAGTPSYRFKGLKVNNNSFTGNINNYTVISYADTLEYIGNTATTTNSNGPYLNISSTNFVTVTKNKINAKDNYAFSGSYINGGTIANNMFGVSGTAQVNAVTISSSNSMNVLNNSFNSVNTHTATTTLIYSYNNMSGTGMKFWNNIVQNTGPGFATKVTTTGIPPRFRNNAYYYKGYYFANFNGTNYTDFSNWKTATNSDTNAISVNAQFTSATNLHVNEILLKGAGTSVSSYFVDDIDGQTRNVSNPDIGADEFTALATDAGTNGFNFNTILCAGTNPVQVVLKNNGTNVLTSANLGCKVNTTSLPVYNWSGSLAPGTQTLVTIGSYSFAFNTNYVIKAWSYLPNGSTDVFKTNDTTYQTYSNAGMSGIFTIGGASPNFTTIGNAITALKNGGLCGPVIFNIRDGIYNEQIKIPNIKGVSATNTILFQSQSLDSSLVSIQYTGTSALNYVATVDSVDYITFYKLGFKALSASYGNILTFTNKTNQVKIKNCLFDGQASSGYLLSLSTNCDSALIFNNRFYKGSVAVYINALYNKVLNNYFEDQSQTSISGNGLNFDYSSNKFVYTAFSGLAINISGTAGGKISKNKIAYTSGTGSAIQILNAGSATNPLYLTNNFISVKGGQGIKLTNVQYGYLLYNSINQAGGASCLNYANVNNSVSQSNIFYSTGGFCVNASGSNPSFSTNYNCIYNAAGKLFSVGSATYSTLAAYTATASMEGNSVSSDPLFNTYSDLHVSNCAAVSGSALYNSNVTDDIDGNPRSAATPDMGADEFILQNIGNDAQTLQTFVTNSGCGGTQTLYAKIKNTGITNLTTVQLSAIVGNASISPVTWNGNLAQGQTKDSISLGTVSNLYGNTSIKAWTFLPNGSVDGNFVNDTIVSQLPNTALKGTYKIGGVDPDFVSLRTAKNALASYGLCGAVVFDLRPGTYQDTLTIPSVVGSSSVNTITFQSENGDSASVILSDFAVAPLSYPHYVVRLNNIGNVIFSKLTFKQLITSNSSFYSQLICVKRGPLSNNASVIVKNCRLLANSYSHFSIYDDGTNLYNINATITNNYFYGGTSCLYLFQGSTGSSSLIKGNVFDEQTSTSIYLRYLSGANHLVEDNIIQSSNLINKTNIRTDAGVTIRRNIIKTFNSTAINGSGALKLYNNYFLVRKITNSNLYGLSFDLLSAASQIYNNTISAEMLGTYPLIYLYNNNTTIKNNIFDNPGNGKIYDVNLNNTLTITNNRYGSFGSQFGSYLSTPASNLQAWKTLTGFDANSQNQVTYFLHDSTYQVIGDYDLNNHALPIAGITTDIENNPRSASTPDIGAYEFNLSNNDAGVGRFVNSLDSVLCSGNNLINVVLRNFGANNLTSATVNWKLNNVTQTPYNWSGTLASGDSAIINLGSVNLSGGQKNGFVFYTSNPNGATDISNFNDTLITNRMKTRLSGIYTVGGSSPNYVTLKQAADSLQRFGVCGPVTYNIRNGIHKGAFQLNRFQGSSSINRVTFQSENQDSSLVTIADSLASITLNANFITIKHLTFKEKGNTGYSAIGILSDEIIVSNCVFSNVILGGDVGLYFQRNYQPMNTYISNNLFKKGTGIHSGSSSIGTYSNVSIYSGNIFEKGTSVNIDEVDSLVFSRNTFDRNLYIWITDCNKSISINNNKFNKCPEIKIENCLASSYSKNFYNNIVDSCFLKLSNVPKMDLYHNTFSFNEAFITGYFGGGLRISGDPTMLRVKNNIFSNTGGGVCISIVTTPSFMGSSTPNIFNNNVLYASRDSIVALNNPSNNSYITRASWQNTYFQDQNSLFDLPSFAGVSDFHIVNDQNIDNVGAPSIYSISDLDGVTRNPTTPDAGAYEFTSVQVPDNAGILNFQNTGQYCNNTLAPISVTLKNYGINNLTSATIQWRVNGVVQPDYLWTGNLTPTTFTTITIGNALFQSGVTTLVEVNSFLPNGNVDGYTGNDTASLSVNSAKLNGVYLVGGSGSNFATLNEVLATLNYNGVCGPVTFKFNPGTYSISSPLTGVLANIPGNSTLNTITFESATGNNSSVIFDVVKFDFGLVTGVTLRNLTLKKSLFVLGLGCKHIKFEGNSFLGYPTYNNGIFSMITSSQYHEDVSIINNYFTNSENDFINYTHNFSPTYQYPKRVIIKGNIFDKPGLSAIDIRNVDSLVIDSNTFFRTNLVTTYNSQAIRIFDPKDYFKISRNKISGTFETGVLIWTKHGNHIGASSIENNSIIGSMATHECISIYCDSISILYNSLHLPQPFAGYTVLKTGLKNKIYNNVITSKGSMLLAIYSPTTTLSDYNVFYNAGTGIATYTYGTTYTFTNLTTYTTSTGMDVNSIVANPQFVNDTLDLHYQNSFLDGKATPLASVLIDQQNKPRHLTTPNPGAYEMPPDTTIDSINKYLSLKSIQTSTLIVGTNNPITASVFYTYPQNTDTNVYKYRGTIDSLRMHYQVNNQPEVIEKWHGTLHLQDSMTYTFTSPFYVPNGKLYSIKVWFENLNPNNYEVNVTDDSLKRVIILPMQGDYTVGGSYPDFADLDQVTTSVYNCGAIGNIRYLIRAGHYGVNFPWPTAFLQEYRPESGNVNEVFIGMSRGSGNCKLTKLHITTSTANLSGIYSPYPGIQCFGFIDVDSCTIRGNAATPAYGGFQFFQAVNTGHSAKITNCHFVSLNFAVSLAPDISGNVALLPNPTDFVFENNTIDSCDYGIMIRKLASNNWIRINHNIFNTNLIGIGFVALNSSGKLNISNNKINSSTSVRSNNNTGVLLDEFVFENNMCKSSYSTFFDIKKLRMVNNSFAGTTILSSADTATVYNNIFHETSTTPIVYNGMTPIGLFMSCNISKTKFEHNNIYAPNVSIKTQINNSMINNISQVFSLTSIGFRTYDFNPLFVSSIDLHSLSANMKNMGVAIATLTTDIDGDARPAGPIDIGADEIQIPFTGVWPGDANSDLQVTSQDLYSIGLHYGNHNYRRDSISDYYVSHLCNDWNVNQIGSSIDMKYADCNGDSLIDMNDTTAINANYNLTHLPKLTAATTTTLTDITLQFNKPLYLPGDTVKADVLIGSATNIQNNFYGASFRISYEANKVKPNTEKMNFINSWVGNTNSTNIKFANINITQGKLDASIVRITHTNVTGYGKIGTFLFVLQDTLTSNMVHISITDADKIDNAATITPLVVGLDSIAVVPNNIPTSINERILNAVSVYPNPAFDHVKIDFGANYSAKCNIEVNAIDGKTILAKAITSDTNVLSLYGIAKGIYTLKLSMEDGTSKVFKLVIQ